MIVEKSRGENLAGEPNMVAGALVSDLPLPPEWAPLALRVEGYPKPLFHTAG